MLQFVLLACRIHAGVPEQRAQLFPGQTPHAEHSQVGSRHCALA